MHRIKNWIIVILIISHCFLLALLYMSKWENKININSLMIQLNHSQFKNIVSWMQGEFYAEKKQAEELEEIRKAVSELARKYRK